MAEKKKPRSEALFGDIRKDGFRNRSFAMRRALPVSDGRDALGRPFSGAHPGRVLAPPASPFRAPVPRFPS